MFSCFTADESTAGLYAAFCNTGNKSSYLFRIVLADCNIVEEEKWLCAAADDVVYTHSNAVDTECIVLVHEVTELNLCAAAVCTGNENWFFIALWKSDETAETAETGKNVLCHCACNACLHEFNSLVTSCYVNARCLVAIAEILHNYHLYNIIFFITVYFPPH